MIPAARRWAGWLIPAVILLAGAALLLPALSPPNRASDRMLGDLVELAGLNGGWWFDEMPWYTPATRTALIETLQSQGAGDVLGDEPSGYLHSNTVQAHRWLREAVDRCRTQLTPAQLRLTERLTEISRVPHDQEKLAAAFLECYDEFVNAATAGGDEWSADDLYARALLEHKRAMLANEQQLAEQALQSYQAALEAYGRRENSDFSAKRLCEADAGRLCFELLSDYPQAALRFESALSDDPSLLFAVDTLAIYGHAARRAGQYRDEKFQDAKRRLEQSRRIGDDHPLRAHVRERYAWSLMDRWSVQRAWREFVDARDIRRVNGQSNRLASIYVFHNMHGVAMTSRYLGDVEAARYEYRQLVSEIDRKLNENLTSQSDLDAQRLQTDLRERLSNSLERGADCILYHSAAQDADKQLLRQAGELYDRAAAEGENTAAIAVQIAKHCIALALSGEQASVEAAWQRLEQDQKERPEVIGDGATRVQLVRHLAKAVIQYQLEGPDAGHAALRRFLVRQCDMKPYDQLRRETFELQLLATELLLGSQLREPDGRSAASKDLRFLVDLLQKFQGMLAQHAASLADRDASADLLPFLHRFYDLALAVVGDTDAGLATQLIMASRGPQPVASIDETRTLRVLFHLHRDSGLAVLVPPEAASISFAVDIGRNEIVSRRRTGASADVQLPEPMISLISAAVDGGRQVHCLWSDPQCWAVGQQDQALMPADFPFVGLPPETVVE
jgi:hypothetical protein